MKKSLTLFALTLLFGFTHEASAATYGNFADPTGTVTYVNVRDVNGLFGAPSVSLDSLDFTPTTYQAACTQCPAGVSTSDTLSLDVVAATGRRIDQLEVSEGLDYTLQSFDASGFAVGRVVASLGITLLEINGSPIIPFNANVPVVFTPSGTMAVNGFGIQSGIILGTSGFIDVDAIVTSAGLSGDVTRLSVAFGNILTAIHDGAGGQAVIRKRDADFVSLTINGASQTPEPTTAVLLMGGLALLAGRRSRT